MTKYNNNQHAMTNLIVNYLPQTTTDKELFSMFVTIGPLESCRVMKDNKTGYSYGFGFVNYTRPEDAARAISSLNGLQIQNKRLKVSYARPSGDDIKHTNLYVTNLPRDITEDQLEALFGQYGKIVQKNILKDKLTGMPRGVAFVRFDRREEANNAIKNLDGVIPDRGIEKLCVKIAEEHGKQKAAYYAGWQAGYNLYQSKVTGERRSVVQTHYDYSYGPQLPGSVVRQYNGYRADYSQYGNIRRHPNYRSTGESTGVDQSDKGGGKSVDSV